MSRRSASRSRQFFLITVGAKDKKGHDLYFRTPSKGRLSTSPDYKNYQAGDIMWKIESLPEGVPTLTQSYPGNESKLSLISLVLSTHLCCHSNFILVTTRNTSGSRSLWNTAELVIPACVARSQHGVELSLSCTQCG